MTHRCPGRRQISELAAEFMSAEYQPKNNWYLSVNSPELIFDLVNAKPGTNHSTNPTNPSGNTNSKR